MRSDGQIGRRTDTTKLIFAFHNIRNVSKMILLLYLIYVGYSESKYRLRILETVTLRMCSDFLYQLRSHRRHFVKFVLCLCLFLYVKHV